MASKEAICRLILFVQSSLQFVMHVSVCCTGYMSDGDVFNKPTKTDVNDGYISEGGAIFYAKRVLEK